MGAGSRKGQIKMPLRLRDIARQAGVSVATVSLVLNDKGSISEDTRSRIKQLLTGSGYIYNKQAAALRTRRSYNVGVLLQDITNPYFAEMLSGLSEYLSNTRYLYFLATAEENAKRQEGLLNAFMGTGLDGAILYLNRETSPRILDYLKKWDKPVVLAYRRFDRDDFDYLGSDHYHGGKIAAEALIRAGHKRIAFAGGSKHTHNRQMRYQGFVDAMRKAGLPVREKDNYFCDTYTRRDGTMLVEKMIAEGIKVTGIMFYTDAMALGAISAFQRRGIEPGRDIGILGFDNIREAEMSIPGLCSVSADPCGMGKRLAGTLLKRIENPDALYVQISEKPTLVIRGSSGQVK